jgi:N-acetyl sugar amidotransferase
MEPTKIRSLAEGYRICSRCIYDSSVPQINFDENGVCNYCKMIDNLIVEYKTGLPEGQEKLNNIVEEIKKAGKNKKYDCMIGVSGGTDSSYLMHWAIQNDLRPLAVHYDNTYNTAIATENILKVTQKLHIDLYTHVLDNKEMDDIYRSFFAADVPELDCATDLGLVEILYRVAAKFGVSYVIEGHSFNEEGITPLGKNYFDGKYIYSIHKKFGKLKMKTYPLMSFYKFIKWTTFKRIKRIRPFWYMNYSKAEAQKLLEKEYDWKYYGGHHLENRMTAFNHGVYFPQKFDIDYRNNNLSAIVRNGKKSRDEAIKEYFETPPYIEPDLIEYIKKRMGYSDADFEKVLNAKPKYWFEYPTYKKRFEILRPFFYLLYKSDFVTKSFYLKYCFPITTPNK